MNSAPTLVLSSQLSSSGRAQAGSAMLFAIAILVVASLLGAAMVRLMRMEQLGVAREVLSTRALLAADSGAQRALGQLFGGTACTTVNTSSISFNGIAGLDNCSATLACTQYDADGSGPLESSYSVVATGSCGAGGDPAVRRVEVLARAP